MDVEIVSQRENKLLKRLEVEFILHFEEGATPARDAVRQELEKVLKVKDKPMVIDSIRSEFGKRMGKGYAKVYDTMEAAQGIERKHILKRNKLLEES